VLGLYKKVLVQSRGTDSCCLVKLLDVARGGSELPDNLGEVNYLGMRETLLRAQKREGAGKGSFVYDIALLFGFEISEDFFFFCVVAQVSLFADRGIEKVVCKRGLISPRKGGQMLTLRCVAASLQST